jgi:hypothetical protein
MLATVVPAVIPEIFSAQRFAFNILGSQILERNKWQ